MPQFSKQERQNRVITLNYFERLRKVFAPPMVVEPPETSDFVLLPSKPDGYKSSQSSSAKISKNRIKVQVVTDRGDYNLQRKAERLDRAVYGVMYNNNWHRAAKQAFIDACICGTGIIQPIPDVENKKVMYERCLPFEVLVDDMDAIYGTPSRYYRWRVYSKAALINKFPEHKEKLMAMQGQTAMNGVKSQEFIVAYEAWSLRNTVRHVVCVDGLDLLDDEEYSYGEPFLFFRWSRPGLGFWGVSLIDEVAPFQLEINKILYYVQRAMQLGHAPKWLMQKGSIPKGIITNQIGAILPYSGMPPQYFAPQPIHSQIVDYLQMLKNEAYAFVGISALSARSEKPAGLESGRALQTYNDIESERFVLVGQAFEELHIDAFKATKAMCTLIADKNPSFCIMSHSSTGGERIKWKDADIDNDRILIKNYPVSALPNEPAARQEKLAELLANGLISPAEFADLADMPDMRMHTEIKYAGYYSARKNVEAILDGEDPMAAEKYDDLETCLTVATNMYLHARDNGVKDRILQNLQEYIDSIQSLIESDIPASPEPLPMTEMPPAPGAGMPPLPPMPQGVPV